MVDPTRPMAPTGGDERHPPRSPRGAPEAEARRLRRRAAALERVLDRLHRAETWDYSVYEQTPGPEWVAVNREDLQALYAAAADAATPQPWRTIIERRPL